ncbi:hypothetical protein ABPG75_005341 [Micractinium tetrahymenae]
MLAGAAACCRLPVGHQPFAAAAKRLQGKRGRLPRAGDGAAGSSSGGGAADELPPKLQGLCISEDGQHLIDSATGKVVNEFGATRFDVAVRAMRGEFDPPAYMDNTERSSGLLLDSLTQFPAVYDFQLVVRRQEAAQQGQGQAAPGSSSGGSSSGSGGGQAAAASEAAGADAEQAVLERYRRLIAETTAADIAPADCSVKPRMGGKYLSLTIPARVQAAHVVDLVWAALADDQNLIMKY